MRMAASSNNEKASKPSPVSSSVRGALPEAGRLTWSACCVVMGRSCMGVGSSGPESSLEPATSAGSPMVTEHVGGRPESRTAYGMPKLSRCVSAAAQ